MNDLLKINPAAETEKIILFIKTTLQTQGFENVVIGLSGGIDSAVSLALLRKATPPQNIFVAHLSYFKSDINLLNSLLKNADIPEENIYNIPIKTTVDGLAETIGLTKNSKDYSLRFGNIMARVRMIILYDLAKKHQALVCGTENKSEYYLGYFTRFGDAASDFEPIRHLYKTQVYQLANQLELPKEIIDLHPTAGLWAGQTDEADFGFSYQEADQVLHLFFDQKKTLADIDSSEFPNAQKIIDRVNKNSFKHNLPYKLEA